MIVFTQLTAVLHKYLNDVLKLLCLLQFFPEVAQNSLSFPCSQKCQVFQVCGNHPFPTLKYKYISEIKNTEAILSNSTRKLLWFEITKTLIALKKNNLLCYLLKNFPHIFVPYFTVADTQRGTSRPVRC